jgi:uncharacterized protein
MMKINVMLVRQEIGSRQSFSFHGRPADQDGLWLTGDITVTGEVTNSGQGLVVTGEISGSAKHVCHRCLDEFDATVTIPFKEIYQQAGAGAPEPDERQAYYSGDEIDISDLVRETLVLSEPLKTLCSENCRGLCPQCGTNLNRGSCACDRDTIDPRLAALQKLLEKR